MIFENGDFAANSHNPTFDVKRLWLVICLWVVVAGVDISQRLNIFVDGVYEPYQANAQSSALSAVKLKKILFDAYQSKLSVRTQIESLPDEETLPPVLESQSDISQNKAIWRPSSDGYQLHAILEGTEKLAVFVRFINNTPDRELLEVRVGDQIDGYVAHDMSHNSVRLKNSQGKYVTLLLFAPPLEEGQNVGSQGDM